MRRIRIYNQAIAYSLHREVMMVLQSLVMLAGSLVLMLGALWWVLHD